MVVLRGTARRSRRRSDDREALIATLDGASLEDLLATAGFLSLAQHGGAGLMVTTGPSDELRDRLARPAACRPVFGPVDLGDVSDGGHASADRLAAAVDTLATALDESTASEERCSSSSGSAAGDGLGAVVMASGSPAALAAALRAAPTTDPVDTLTSDSTRRDGVVTSDDVVHTAIVFVAPDAETDLERRADPDRRRTAADRSPRPIRPVETADGADRDGRGGVRGARQLDRDHRALEAGRLRGDTGAFCASLAISVPFVALSLLLVGHLPSLTYATVIPFVIATTAIATLALVPAARRWGTLGAIATAGVILLVALAIEGVLGWPAALTPLLGGSQLDGGRFFGLPNAFIGLLLGGSLYVAQRLPRTAGTVLIAAAGLFAGSPWTGLEHRRRGHAVRRRRASGGGCAAGSCGGARRSRLSPRSPPGRSSSSWRTAT